MRAAGFDSLKIELGASPTKFEGLLGVGVTVSDETSFRQRYVSILRSVFKSRGIICNRVVYKSADIARFFPNTENMIYFLESFFNDLNDEIERIDVYYTRFNSKRTPFITIYGDDSPERIKPVEFIRRIASGYPHICAWRYLYHFQSKGIECITYLDHFESDYTLAWEFISRIPNVRVLYKGDSCNCLLSSADLFIRLTTLLLKRTRAAFNWKGLKAIHSPYPWADKVSVNTLGAQKFILNYITPRTRKRIDLSPFISHPIVFVPHEKPGGLKAKDEQKVFENLPVYTKLLNFLFYINGSFKYFDPVNDVKLIREGDYMLIMGKHGEELYDYLIAGGAPLTKITKDDIISKLENLQRKEKFIE
ncbi:hypothetical protein CW705_02840 [Candidatus Bathyarchaeota archaeon]|nr:MAG: hypothetical protein CW705_02840 [Candidatus Bathyarchaeota archaeon]